MITVEDLDFLLTFYSKLNNKLNNKLDLNSIRIDDDLEYSFKEDIIENIKESLNDFETSITKLKKVDLDENNVEQLVYLRDFLSGINTLYRVLGELSLEFKDFQDFDIQISKKLPEGPREDSELK
ncbi:hypothetical protein ACYRFS_01630 [Listeria kieliensis]